MARLPVEGGDVGEWGETLNEYLGVSINPDGTLSATAVATAIGPSGATPGTYGDATHVAQVTINTEGLVTGVTAVGISGGGGGAVSSVFTRTGGVTAQSGDYTVSQVTGAAPLASPALSGTPTAPTASALTDNTQLATTAYADSAVASAVAVYNVKTYGATGNGTTVDTAAIQNAVSAALAAQGGTVLFPPGTYVMSDVTFGSNITVRGSGKGNTVLLMDPSATTGSQVCRVAPASGSAQTSYCHLADLTIDGNKSAWGSNNNQRGYGYYLGQATAGLITNCSVTNVEFRNCLSYACDVENVQAVNVTSCISHDNGYSSGTGTNHVCDGFTSIGSDISHIGCISFNNSGRGYQIGQDGVTWYRNKLIGCSGYSNTLHGAQLASNSGSIYDCAVVGGDFTLNGESGLELGAGSQRCTVSGCIVVDNVQDGIRIESGSYHTVVGNTAANNNTGAGGYADIYMTSTSTYNTITGNTVDTTGTELAIAEQNSACDFNIITDNVVVSGGASTISISGTHTIVSNNQGYAPALTPKTTTYSQTAADTTIFCDATSGAFTVSLLDATTVRAGQPYVIKKVDETTNNVTLLPTGSSYVSGQLVPGTETIDGAFYYILGAAEEGLALTSDGSNWRVS